MANVQIIQGQDVTLIIDVIDSSQTPPQPYNLAGMTACEVLFANTDGTVLAATGILVSQDLGRVQCQINDTDTLLLASGESQNFEMKIEQGALVSIVQFAGLLDVLERYFPGT